IDQDEFPVDRIADAAEDAVGAILRMTVDEDLRGEQLLAALLDLDVDVRRATGIRHRFDGAEAILAIRPGGEATEALEVGIAGNEELGSEERPGSESQGDAAAQEVPAVE